MKPIVKDHKGRLWCGLAVLSGLTGKGTELCRQAASQFTNGRRVAGLYQHELTGAAESLGWKLVWHRAPTPQPTLNQWRRTHREHLNGKHPVIIQVTGHWVMGHKGMFQDSLSGEPVRWSKSPCKRKRVIKYALCTPTGAPTFQPKPKQADLHRQVRFESKALAALNGITIEPYENAPEGSLEFWVYPPRQLDSPELDAYCDDHLAFEWDDVNRRVRRYSSDLANLLTKSEKTLL